MKILLSLAALFVAFNANAVDAGSSWGEIRGSSAYVVDAPKIHFGNVQTSVFGVCAFNEEGTEMLYGGKTTECTKYRQQGEDAICVETKEVPLIKSRAFTKTVCARIENGKDNDCAEYKTIVKKEKLNYNVDVYTHHKDGASPFPVFSKEYTVPACS